MIILFLRLELNRKIDTDVVRMVGKQKSIGLLIMASGSAEDSAIPEGPPHVAEGFLAPVGLIKLSNTTNLLEEKGE